jgi:membrane-associated phospholipid phosphatase
MILGGGIAFILVALATLFVRQHYVVDVFAGMLIVSIAYLMVRI